MGSKPYRRSSSAVDTKCARVAEFRRSRHTCSPKCCTTNCSASAALTSDVVPSKLEAGRMLGSAAERIHPEYSPCGGRAREPSWWPDRLFSLRNVSGSPMSPVAAIGVEPLWPSGP